MELLRTSVLYQNPIMGEEGLTLVGMPSAKMRLLQRLFRHLG